MFLSSVSNDGTLVLLNADTFMPWTPTIAAGLPPEQLCAVPLRMIGAAVAPSMTDAADINNEDLRNIIDSPRSFPLTLPRCLASIDRQVVVAHDRRVLALDWGVIERALGAMDQFGDVYL